MSNKDYRELQVSSSQLVVIFIGILIVCGVSFLLGVNVGKKKAELQGRTTLPSPQVLAKVQDQKPAPDETAALKQEAAAAPAPKTTSRTPGGSSGAVKTAPPTSSPAPGSAAKTVENPKPAPAKATAAPPTGTPKTTPPKTTAPALTAAKGTYSIQVGAYEKREDALQVAKKYDGQGYICRVLDPLPTDRIKYYRVRIGAFKSREEAQAARGKFLTSGMRTDSFVVQN
jgi:DedD protein